jgi:hypothetical protein
MAATLTRMQELDIITGDDRMAHWQFIKPVIEHRYGDLPKEEAIETMAFYSGLDPFFCEIMLKELRKESLKTLLISFPDLPPCPWFVPHSVRQVQGRVRGTSRGS